MKNKLKFLIGISLKRKIGTKWFKVANVLLAILIVGLINIDSIISYFGGDFNEKTNILVIDNIDSFEIFKESVKNINTSLGNEDDIYTITKYDKTKEDAIELLETDEEKDSIVLIINDSEKDVIDVTMITNAYLGLTDIPILTSAINNTKLLLAIEKYDISDEELAALSTGVTVNREVLDESKQSTDEAMEAVMSTVFPIVTLPFFMLTIFLVQMIGAEVNDEKTTKGMEIIIANVSPKVHFSSKIIAGNLFILLQGALIIIFAIIGIFVRKMLGTGMSGNIGGVDISGMLSNILTSDVMSTLKVAIPFMLVLMLLSFITYSLLAGILASVTTNTEDFQQMQTPIMLILLVGYYLSIMAGLFKGAVFIKILSYVPLLSAILSPTLFVLGEVGVIDLIISILLTVGLNFLLIRYGLRIYKVGILNYSSKGLWKKIFGALKNN